MSKDGMQSVRNSNMELFRIVATFMILIVHHNGWFLNDFGHVGGWWAGGEGFALTRTFIQAATCIGVDCFILISGYFSIHPKGRSLLNMFTLLVFFYVGSFLFNCYLNGVSLWQPRAIFRCCRAFSRENWFIQCYLFLVLLSPILNTFVDRVSEKKLILYLVSYAACALYFGCFLQSRYFYFNDGYSVTTFVLLYLVGRYVRLYGQHRLSSVRTPYICALWLICTFVIMMGYLFIPQWHRFWNYCSPIQIVSASLLLICFSRVSFQSSFVNEIGISCLSVYILHTCSPFLGWLIDMDIIAFNAGSVLYWLGAMLVHCVIIFIIAIVLDKIRIYLSTPLFHLYDRLMAL